MNDARQRFLREIAERLPPERLSELHLFTPLRQGGIESGVAVVAVEPEAVAVPEAVVERPLDDVLAEACDPTDASAAPAVAERASPRPHRHTVYTARYRHTLKGTDRGKWEFELVAEADAPLVTVDAVVRGVLKRTGELAEPARLGPDDVRAALDDTPWRATTA